MAQGQAFNLGPESWTENRASDEPTPEDVSQPTTLFSPAYRRPPPVQWSTSLIPAHYDFGDPEMSFVYERASGTAQAVDSITLSLNRQRLDADTDTPPPPPLFQTGNAANATTTPWIQTVDAPRQKHIPSLQHQPHTISPISPTPDPLAPLHQADAPRRRPSAGISSNQVQRKATVRILHTTQESLTEDMIYSGTPCTLASPMSTLAPTGARGLSRAESEATLPAEQIMTGDAEYETPVFRNFLATRRTMRPSGINKDGLLAYRTSTDTALRCQNLVRSRPRMRKRVKLHKKENPPIGSSIAGSAAACATSAS
ncbi:unnamed protein product [Discula destructiva]